jgi:predicted nucleotidyltransferase
MKPSLREKIRSVFRGKPVERVELFGSAARGGMTPQSDVDILITPVAFKNRPTGS